MISKNVTAWLMMLFFAFIIVGCGGVGIDGIPKDPLSPNEVTSGDMTWVGNPEEPVEGVADPGHATDPGAGTSLKNCEQAIRDYENGIIPRDSVPAGCWDGADNATELETTSEIRKPAAHQNGNPILKPYTIQEYLSEHTTWKGEIQHPYSVFFACEKYQARLLESSPSYDMALSVDKDVDYMLSDSNDEQSEAYTVYIDMSFDEGDEKLCELDSGTYEFIVKGSKMIAVNNDIVLQFSTDRGGARGIGAYIFSRGDVPTYSANIINVSEPGYHMVEHIVQLNGRSLNNYSGKRQ